MFKTVPFEAAHVEAIELQDTQTHLSGWVSKTQAEALEGSFSWTMMHDGKPIAAAGVIPQWNGRAVAWAFISNTGPNMFLPVFRAIHHFLDGCYIQRIEMSVDCEFPEAHRFAKMLGFTMEAPRMRAYDPDGRDCALYARVL